MYKDTVLILYPAGGYGSFLHWCLEYFSNNLPQGHRPFKTNGSAHLFEGLKLDFLEQPMLTTDEYLQGASEFQFGRTHAMYSDDANLKRHCSYIDTYKSCFKKIVSLNLSANVHLLVQHNKLTKTKLLSYDALFDKTIKKYQSQFNAVLPVPRWQLREMLSFNHEGDFLYTTTFYQPVVDPKVINVGINDLVFDFQSTVRKLFLDLGLAIQREDELAQLESQWLAIQKFTNVDRLCQNILRSVLDEQPMSWQSEQLTILDEAYVQHLLRTNRLEIKCFGLDTFPTDSVQLRELLYPI